MAGKLAPSYLRPGLVLFVPARMVAPSLTVSEQDMQCVENCGDSDERNHVLYEQPVWQTLQMFRAHISAVLLASPPSSNVSSASVGEMLCPC